MVFVELLRQFSWRQVALLAEDGQDFPEYHGFLQDLFISSGINVVHSRRLPRQATTDDSIKVWWPITLLEEYYLIFVHNAFCLSILLNFQDK